jgi:TrmH family RNA methyltransferase
VIITSVQNPKIKSVAALRGRRDRDRTGLMPVEGYDELSVALSSGAIPAQLLFCPALFPDPRQAELVERLRATGTEVIEVGERVFEKIAYRSDPDGWLAVFPIPHRRLSDLQLSDNPLLVVAESVEKPGNLGAILRTADAAGLDAVISSSPLTDWGNPNVVRSSKGALFTVQVAGADNAETMHWLRERGIVILAATPDATTLYTEADMRRPVAIVVGTERHGLSAGWLEHADTKVRIPMVGRVNSLNVSIATALLVYEAVKQRG